MNMIRNFFFAVAMMVVVPACASEGAVDLPVGDQSVENPAVVVVTPVVENTINALKADGLSQRAKIWVLKNLDGFARFIRADKVAEYLASPSKDDKLGRVATFFSGKEKIVSRTVAVVTVAGVCVAAYKVYQSLTTPDEDDVDEYDFGIFNEEDFDVEEGDIE